MKKFLVLLLAITLLTVALSGCNNSEKPSINDESTINTTSEQDPSAEPNPATDFEYETNSDGGITIVQYMGSNEMVIII